MHRRHLKYLSPGYTLPYSSLRPLKPSPLGPLRPLLILKIRRKRLVIMLPARRYREHHRPKPPPELILIREHFSEHACHHGRIVPVDAAPEGG